MGVIIRNISRIKEIQGTLKALSKYEIHIGVFSDSGDAKNGTNYALIAGVHEFGATIEHEKGAIHIPERSFIRSTFDEKANEWAKFVQKRLPKVILGQMAPRQLVELLGEKITADIKLKIKAINDPPNAPSTIAKKKSSSPLIDTDGLRQRVTYKVVSK